MGQTGLKKFVLEKSGFIPTLLVSDCPKNAQNHIFLLHSLCAFAPFCSVTSFQELFSKATLMPVVA